MARIKNSLRFIKTGCALAALAALSACGGGGTSGGVASTPTPSTLPPATPAAPPPAPTPTVSTNYDTSEYRRSNAAVQAKALTAYQNGATGKGVTVAVIDGGIAASNAEFAGRIHSASADVAGSRDIVDVAGHGTAVAAVLAAGRDGNNVQGVAFDATILVARTDTPGSCVAGGVDQGCSHNDANIAKGIDLAVANGARVINVSLGGSPANAALRSAIQRAANAGVIMVFSAGNEFDNDPASAANPDPLAQVANDSAAGNMVIIAGALDSNNTELTAFSNRAGNGAAHYLSALGTRVRSIDEKGESWLFTGTSFAAPVVAGAAALLAQAFPNLTGQQIIQLLFRSATDLGTSGVDTTFGHGALDIARAFQPQGATSLAGSAIPITTTQEGGLSAPMGDSSQSGASATFLDGYGRAYTLDLGSTIGRSRLAPRLAGALETNRHAVQLGAGRASLSLSIRQGASQAVVERNLLSPHQAGQAQALAGHAYTQLTGRTSLALGFAQGASGLARSLSGQGASPFLVSAEADSGWGFDYRPGSSMVMRHRVGALTLHAGGELGDVRRWDQQAGRARLSQDYRAHAALLGADWSQNRLTLGARATLLNEKHTVLGARFAAFLGAPGARTLFADARMRLDGGDGWAVSGQMRRGWTHVSAGGLRQTSDVLQSSAWSIDVQKHGVWTARDTLALRLSQPLRIASGGLGVTLPVAYDYTTGSTSHAAHRINLAPDGRERNAELGWTMPLAQGSLGTTLFWRKDPGNVAARPDDVGAALRFDWGF